MAKRIRVSHDHALPRQPLTARELRDALMPVVRQEMASIGAIDAAMPREREPGYVMLLRAAKLGKQANVEQMSTMLRMLGVAESPRPAAIEPLLKIQTGAFARLGTTPLLRAMRVTESMIAARYEALVGVLEGPLGKGMQKCWRRARKHLIVLAAHIAIRGAKPEIEERIALPWPLEHYFAHGEPRVCFRCLFDRPGALEPLERSDPHPYQYICGRCHEEVLGDLPADLMESSRRWPDRERENLVIEHAMGRPSKLKAELLVLNRLAGLAPDLPEPPTPRKAAFAVTYRRPPRELDRITVADVEPMQHLEREYVARLFDYESVRETW